MTGVKRAIVLAVCATALFGFRLGERSLENADIIRNADLAAETLRDGHWLVPRSCGQAYLEKPPLMVWAVAASGKCLGGVTPLSARLPSLLAGILLVLATSGIGAMLRTPRTGFVAGLLVMTLRDTWMLARSARDDMLFAALTTSAAWALLRAVRGGGGAAWTAGVLLMAGAAMIKGPLGIAFPWIALAADGPGRRSAFRGGGAVAAAAAAAVAGGYYLAVLLREPEVFRPLVETFFLKENLARAVTGWDHRPKPFWYYGPALMTNTLPWAVLLPALLLHWRRTWRDGAGLVLWFAVPVLLLSLSTGKESRYLLPVFPPMAILLAGVLEEERPFLLSWLLPAALCVAGAGVLLGFGNLPLRPTGEAAGILALGLVSGWALGRRRPGLFLASVWMAFFLGTGVWGRIEKGKDEAKASCQRMAAELAPWLDRGRPVTLGSWAFFRSGLCFHLGRTLPLVPAVYGNPPEGWLLVEAKPQGEGPWWVLNALARHDMREVLVPAKDWRPEASFSMDRMTFYLVRTPTGWAAPP